MITLSAPTRWRSRVTHNASPVDHAWRDLAARVRRFCPDVVILVARKMPRLVELHRLDFGPGCLIISDLALPFAHQFLKDARVAVLDDVVNVGSTIEHARTCAIACGANEVRLFSLGRKAQAKPHPVRELEIECVYEEALSESDYARLVGRVPELLWQLAKPYDLVFPTIPCRLNVPFRSVSQVLAFLRDQWGHASVHFLTPATSRSGLVRATLDLPEERGGNNKLRLYFDEDAGLCNLVPFAIPPRLSAEAFDITSPSAQRIFGRLQRALYKVPLGVSLWDGEPLCQARLFAASLDHGLRALHRLSDVFSLAGPTEFDVGDARMLFGPAAVESDGESSAEQGEQADGAIPPKLDKDGSHASPFLRHIRAEAGFLDQIRIQAGGSDARALFSAFFSTLAEWVGAANPAFYRLTWPYSLEEVTAAPYKRLRIGPTFSDLLAVINELLPPDSRAHTSASEPTPLRNILSALLDYAIDCGAVVPTIAQYEGHFFRIYRQGEAKDQRDIAEDRVLYAWRTSDRKLSLTTFTKLNTVLAFARDIPPVLSPLSLTRGNVASLPACVLDPEAPEIGRCLRDTGKIQRVEIDSTRESQAGGVAR